MADNSQDTPKGWALPFPVCTRGDMPSTATSAMSTRLERRAYRLAEKQHARDQHQDSSSDEGEQDGKPAGGYDSTPLHPSGQTSYVVKLTFHRATNLPTSDLHGLASDPYLMVKLETPSLPKRHVGDPDILFRTTTKHCTTDPVWNEHWILGGIPEAGIQLSIKIMDEDRMNHDDHLGDVKVNLDDIGATEWTHIVDRPFEISFRHASKRANLVRAAYTVIHPVRRAISHHHDKTEEHHREELYLSIEVLEKMSPDQDVGKAYTIGPCRWFQHYSPLIGRIAGTKESSSDTDHDHGQLSEAGPGQRGKGKKDDKKDDNKTERFDFQANEIQFQGPMPSELYHRYVSFKAFVPGMFRRKGIRGTILNHVLHHQHASIYQYDKFTKYGSFDAPSKTGLTAKFLELAHYDEGGRLFTYVITLDGLMRFTETGKEFSIDLLSKHTMHADVALFIAWSGEFLIRRLKRPGAKDAEGTHPPDPIPGGPPKEAPPKDPSYYEAIFDNDSGTYRPNFDVKDHLVKFLEKNLPGLRIVVYNCTDERLKKIKEKQKEIKRREGDKRVYVQQHGSDSSSDEDGISSSDESELDRRMRAGEGGKASKGKLERAFDMLQFSKSGKKD